MNILIVSQYAGSERHGMVFRNYALAREWVKSGHKVTIIASSYSASRNFQPKIKGRVTEEYIDGIKYLWLWGPRLKNNAIGRIVMMFAFFVQVFFRNGLEDNFDVVVTSSPHPFLIYPSKHIADRSGAKLVYDIRDLWPLTLILIGNISERNLLIKLMGKAETYACKFANLVTSVPRNAKQYLESKGMASDKFLHIGNGAWETNERDILPKSVQSLIDSLKRNNTRLLGYTGALGIVNDVQTLLRAFAIKSTGVQLLIVGDGICRKELEMLSIELKIEKKVNFIEPIAKSCIQPFLSQMDFVYAGTKKNILYDYGVSLTKMNDYMLAAKPIIYAVGDSNNPVQLSGAGICCEAENAKEISNALKQFENMTSTQLSRIGALGNSWCLKNQLVSKQAELILNTLKRSVE